MERPNFSGVTQGLGSRWAAGKVTAVMSVPSAVIPHERNYLLNPAHPDFAKIKFKRPRPFVFVPRLK
ncbi:MAG: RES family NAD+ phosphorylase [Bryobacteraceae bacterium]